MHVHVSYPPPPPPTPPPPTPGHCDCINTLVGSGADVNAKDKKQYTPLHSAAAGGQSHAVKLLLELGANVSGAWWLACQYSVRYRIHTTEWVDG